MGAPKATATPLAALALSISRLLAREELVRNRLVLLVRRVEELDTIIVVVFRKQSARNVPNARRNVNVGAIGIAIRMSAFSSYGRSAPHPSLPKLRPDETLRINASVLTTSVLTPR